MLWLQRVQPDSCPVKTVANNKSCIVIRLGWPPPPQSLPWDGGSELGRGPEPPGGVEAEAQQRGLAGSLQAAEHTGNDPSAFPVYHLPGELDYSCSANLPPMPLTTCVDLLRHRHRQTREGLCHGFPARLLLLQLPLAF